MRADHVPMGSPRVPFLQQANFASAAPISRPLDWTLPLWSVDLLGMPPG
jgi:hypothetical protein